MRITAKQGILYWEEPWLRHTSHIVCHCNHMTQERIDVYEHYYLIFLEKPSSVRLKWYWRALEAHFKGLPIPKLPYGGMLALS